MLRSCPVKHLFTCSSLSQQETAYKIDEEKTQAYGLLIISVSHFVAFQ
jgi:hypothetical protein